MANIFVSDYAGAVDSQVTTEMFVKFTVMALVVRNSLTAPLASSLAVGKPIQGNLRQLPSARWNYMYPS